MNDDTLLTQDDLLPGDVLLHLGRGDLSELIAWAGDGEYSHAAMVLDAQQLIEAGAKGVVEMSLETRLQQADSYHYIDAFRRRQPAPLPSADVEALRHAARSYLGRGYPMNQLIQLGLACAVRNKLSDDPTLRLILRIAVDAFLASDDDRVVCSELVYRCFDEAPTEPAHALRLAIDLAAVPHKPWPEGVDLIAFLKTFHIDLPALLDELLRKHLPAQREALLASVREQEFATRTSGRGRPELAASDAPVSADTDDLQRRIELARSRLGIADGRLRAPLDPGSYVPNPKAVLPADLEYSPDLQRIGRLRLAS